MERRLVFCGEAWVYMDGGEGRHSMSNIVFSKFIYHGNP